MNSTPEYFCTRRKSFFVSSRFHLGHEPVLGLLSERVVLLADFFELVAHVECGSAEDLADGFPLPALGLDVFRHEVDLFFGPLAFVVVRVELALADCMAALHFAVRKHLGDLDPGVLVLLVRARRNELEHFCSHCGTLFGESVRVAVLDDAILQLLELLRRERSALQVLRVYLLEVVPGTLGDL